MFLLLAAAAVSLASVQPADVQQAAPASAVVPAAEKKICKRMQSAGSRLGGQMVCGTREEWATMKNATRDDMDRLTVDRATLREGD